jgi:predicted ATPase
MKIILTGAHGTGKSTLVEPLATEYKLPVFQRTVRNFWEANGVKDFELLPSDVRAIFQKHLLLNQLDKENTMWEQGFITDRSVLDYLGYAVVSSSMSKTDLDLYKALIRERLLQYDYIIYLPVEFPAEPEYLRANPQSQAEVGEVLEEHLNLWLSPEQYCVARGSVDQRLGQIKNFIERRGVELSEFSNAG